jgi:putative FmdB family regulatory protein|tara:strand:+ start:1190 stop:1414 length:225 start_codon:yes stop_codon:yes gene_type:complete
MPIYEYKCTCGARFETIQSMNDKKLVKCNKNVHDCKEDGKLTRLISSPMIISDDIGRGAKRMTDEHLRKELDID